MFSEILNNKQINNKIRYEPCLSGIYKIFWDVKLPHTTASLKLAPKHTCLKSAIFPGFQSLFPSADLTPLLAGSLEYSGHFYSPTPSSMSLSSVTRLSEKTAPQVTGRGLLPTFLLVAVSFETEDFSAFLHLVFWCKIPEMSLFSVRHTCYNCYELLKL